MIAAHPQAGDVIQGTGGLRKVRIPLKDRGKRGGGRVIIFFQGTEMPVFLIAVYALNVQADLDPRQPRAAKALTAAIRAQFGRWQMANQDFGKIVAGLDDALSYAKGDKSVGAREHRVRVDRTFIAQTRLKAGLTQEEFAKVTWASLGTVRKWERGERSPSGAAGMLVRILACDPALVIQEAGLSKTTMRRRSSRSNRAA